MRTRPLVAVMALVLTVAGLIGCSPLSQTGPDAPTAADVSLRAAMEGNIRLVYSDVDWYETVGQVDGHLDLAARDGTLIVGYVGDPARADWVCSHIASVSFDENAKPLGLKAVVVVQGAKELARCAPGS